MGLWSNYLVFGVVIRVNFLAHLCRFGKDGCFRGLAFSMIYRSYTTYSTYTHYRFEFRFSAATSIL